MSDLAVVFNDDDKLSNYLEDVTIEQFRKDVMSIRSINDVMDCDICTNASRCPVYKNGMKVINCSFVSLN